MYSGVLLKFAFSVWKLGRKEVNSRSNTLPCTDWFFFCSPFKAIKYLKANWRNHIFLRDLDITILQFHRDNFWLLSVKDSHYWLQKFGNWAEHSIQFICRTPQFRQIYCSSLVPMPLTTLPKKHSGFLQLILNKSSLDDQQHCGYRMTV